MKTRANAAQVLFQVVEQGQSLSSVLPLAQQQVAPKDRALLQELCFGSLRWLSRLEAIAARLMSKPLKGKQRPLHYLLLIGLYQLLYTRIPAHAALSETVNGCRLLKGESFRGLLNGVLRNVQRNQAELEAEADRSETARYAHPNWLLKRLKQAYPSHWQHIAEQNNQRPPMWLRVNQCHQSRDAYQTQLNSAGIPFEPQDLAPQGILLSHPCDVQLLPGFAEGDCSVQDGAAQQAARLLDPQPGEWILDACAAPGGKSAHLLECQPQLAGLVAIDADATRLSRIHENLERLRLNAQVIHGDACTPDKWWQGPQFDRILLDAPCSATGVIRRHPDIKWLRRSDDIAELVKLQANILEALWCKLKPGGTLLYATCSVLPDENRAQIQRFLASHPDAQWQAVVAGETREEPGWQLLPGDNNMDGFFYAKLIKQ
ncbi:MAG: 16S rRNA (cytosine(967)-C(5))-methyltransferase RsmB [Aeromonadaceae bacterium]